jgi:hypothetical protein
MGQPELDHGIEKRMLGGKVMTCKQRLVHLTAMN